MGRGEEELPGRVQHKDVRGAELSAQTHRTVEGWLGVSILALDPSATFRAVWESRAQEPPRPQAVRGCWKHLATLGPGSAAEESGLDGPRSNGPEGP